MVFPLNLALNASAEIADAAHWPNFRIFTVGTVSATTEQFNVSGNWTRVSPKTIPEFSAVCYMTARNVARMHTGSRPVGLIQSAVGGTRVEAWMSPDAIAECPHPPLAGRQEVFLPLWWLF